MKTTTTAKREHFIDTCVRAMTHSKCLYYIVNLSRHSNFPYQKKKRNNSHFKHFNFSSSLNLKSKYRTEFAFIPFEFCTNEFYLNEKDVKKSHQHFQDVDKMNGYMHI